MLGSKYNNNIYNILLLFQVWELDSDGNIKEKLGRFDSVWPGLLKAPDAGFTWTNGLTYLFQGKKQRDLFYRRVAGTSPHPVLLK